jgi:hypothetical protein
MTFDHADNADDTDNIWRSLDDLDADTNADTEGYNLPDEGANETGELELQKKN